MGDLNIKIQKRKICGKLPTDILETPLHRAAPVVCRCAAVRYNKLGGFGGKIHSRTTKQLLQPDHKN